MVDAYAIPLHDLTLDDLPRVGGKNASLGEMLGALGERGVQVPDGFALTVAAFHDHLAANGLTDRIREQLDALDIEDVDALAETGRTIRDWIQGAPLPEAVVAAIRTAYEAMAAESGIADIDVAVRSSATAEDLPDASFAGQQETYLNVHGIDDLLEAVRACMASLFTDRAIVYRQHRDIPIDGVGLSVGVQRMVRSDSASAGVIFTLDTESGFRDAVLITGSWGLGELVVQGRVSPDEFWVHKPTLRDGHRPIVRREIGAKAIKLVYAEAGGRVRERRVSRADRERPVLEDDEILTLARWSLIIEDHYSDHHGRATPMDIEWAKDGRTGELFIVQARPETVHSREEKPVIELFHLEKGGEVLLRGKSVGGRIGTGAARVIHDTSELARFQPGEVLVAEMTDPDWEPVLKRAAAVVTDHGGRTCHAAIVSRELGIPCVVGTRDGSTSITDGRTVTVSCAEGDEGRVYAGELPYRREVLDPAELPDSPVPLMLNLADPDLAFHVARLPTAGVGLLRMEFLINNWIGVHPMALVHPDRISDETARNEIRKRCAGHERPEDFFVERLASGVGQIAAAFYPRPVTLRLSDFKTNEYAGLLGGADFEPAEHNPMIGFRGASRYYDDHYRDGFALECRAIRRVREDMGLTNLKLMVPFCRTIDEGRKVLAEMEANGLRQGEDGLEVLVMCEIPNNVVLAAEFSELFDGFSIGSNDLTQLVLGVDRDSEQLAHIFDEQDAGVKRMIEQVVRTAHDHGRPVGICGQAPSDHPEFAAFLADIGIDSMSLTPDAVPIVARHLAGGGNG